MLSIIILKKKIGTGKSQYWQVSLKKKKKREKSKIGSRCIPRYQSGGGFLTTCGSIWHHYSVYELAKLAKGDFNFTARLVLDYLAG